MASWSFLTTATIWLLISVIGCAKGQSRASCASLPAASSCVRAISSRYSRTASASSFCSSVLGCTSTPTITLTGAPVTTTSTKVVLETFTLEELGEIFATTSTYSFTETSSSPSATTIISSTYYIEKFVITTVTPKKRDATVHPKDLAGRATTTTPLCPANVASSACSCLVICPATVTKDRRKTVKEKTTETSYIAQTTSVPYTDVVYDPISFTETAYYLTTSTDSIISTHTTTVKCTPTISNPSFYLRATNAPSINSLYMQTYPRPLPNNALPSLQQVHFVSSPQNATVFHLDSTSRLLAAHTSGTLYAHADYLNDFQLFEFLTRGEIQIQDYLYAYCVLGEPSGRYEGGLRELTCRTRGAFDLHIFQYCPEYVEYYETGLVLGARRSPEAPLCQDVVFLVVPVCG